MNLLACRKPVQLLVNESLKKDQVYHELHERSCFETLTHCSLYEHHLQKIMAHEKNNHHMLVCGSVCVCVRVLERERDRHQAELTRNVRSKKKLPDLLALGPQVFYRLDTCNQVS